MNEAIIRRRMMREEGKIETTTTTKPLIPNKLG
jgi:hypothetical protein